MYTVCTSRLSQALDAPFLTVIPAAFVYVALAAWLLVMTGLVRELFRQPPRVCATMPSSLTELSLRRQ